MPERVSKMWKLPNVCTNFGIFRRDPKEFLRDWWLWTKPDYFPMNRRQSYNQYSGGIAAYPDQNYSECKNPWKISRLDFFGIKTASSSLTIFQTANVSMRSITHLCCCNWKTFWRKTPREGEQGFFFFQDNTPTHRALATQKILNYWVSNILITHPILQIWPRRTTTCSLEWKNNCKIAIFVQHGDMIGRTTFWIFF